MSSSSASSDAHVLARDFTKHLNHVLNRTVSRSRVQLVLDKTAGPSTYLITRVVNNALAPLELNGSRLLLDVQQRIEVSGVRPTWLAYSYRVQDGVDKNSWLVRWESHPPRVGSPYPRYHLHVNGARDGFELSRLHLATYRLPIESIIWTLLADFDVQPLDDDWQNILEESIAGYEERQR